MQAQSGFVKLYVHKEWKEWINESKRTMWFCMAEFERIFLINVLSRKLFKFLFWSIREVCCKRWACVLHKRNFAKLLFYLTSNSKNNAVGTREKTYLNKTENFAFKIIFVFGISWCGHVSGRNIWFSLFLPTSSSSSRSKRGISATFDKNWSQ